MMSATRAWAWRNAPCVAGPIFIVASVLTVPRAASAQWTAFLPTPYENHAWIETYGSWERDNSKGSARNLNWNDTFFREKLSVASLGYSYDPRFLQYKLSIAGAAKQEDYQSSTSGSAGWKEAEAIEYDARLFFLPEHRYNGQVYASRHEPV